MSEIKFLSRCTPEQKQAVYQLYLNSFGHYDVQYDKAKQSALFEQLLVADWFDAIIDFDSGKARGFCFFTNSYSSMDASFALRIEEIFIHADYRGQGIGTQLLENLIRHSERNSISKIHLLTTIRDKEAMDFYMRLGFEPSDHLVFLSKTMGQGPEH